MSSERPWVDAADAAALRAAGRLERMIGDRPVLLLWHDGRAHAVDALCPHASAPLSQGFVEAGRLHCPGHRASFDLNTGAVDPGWRLPPLGVHDVCEIGGRIAVRFALPCTATKPGGSSPEIR